MHAGMSLWSVWDVSWCLVSVSCSCNLTLAPSSASAVKWKHFYSLLHSFSFSFSVRPGLELVCERQEATEEHGEAAGPELGAEDQTVQQICPGQRREAEHQQRRQLLRRWGWNLAPFSLFWFRGGLCTLDDSPTAKITAGLLKVTPDLHRLLNPEPKKVALQH